MSRSPRPRRALLPIVALALGGCFDPSSPSAAGSASDGSSTSGTSAGPTTDPTTTPSTTNPPSTTSPSTTVDPDTGDSTSATTVDETTTGPSESSSSSNGDTTEGATTDAESSTGTGPVGVLLFEDTFERPNSPDLDTSEFPGGEWTETTIIGPGAMSILDGALVGEGNGYAAHDDEIDCATLRLRAVASFGTVDAQSTERLLIKYDQNGPTTGGGYGISIDTSVDEGGDHIGILGAHIGLPPPPLLAQTAANNVLDAGVDYYLELITSDADAVLTVREDSYAGGVVASVNTGAAPAPAGNLNNVLIRIDRTDGAPSATTVGEISLRCEE